MEEGNVIFPAEFHKPKPPKPAPSAVEVALARFKKLPPADHLGELARETMLMALSLQPSSKRFSGVPSAEGLSAVFDVLSQHMQVAERKVCRLERKLRKAKKKAKS